MNQNDMMWLVDQEAHRNGLTMKQVFDKAGVPESTYRRWKKGANAASLNLLSDLLEAVGLELDVRRKRPANAEYDWESCDIAPKSGMYVVTGWTYYGKRYVGNAVYYPDGYWYTLNGNRMSLRPDCWAKGTRKPITKTAREGEL